MAWLTDEQEALVLQHLWVPPVVLRTQLHLTPDHWDDALQDGRIGLCQAARTFDESHGVLFSTWAKPRIRGAILDGLRARRGGQGGRRRPDSMRSLDEPIHDDGLGTPLLWESVLADPEARAEDRWADQAVLTQALGYLDEANDREARAVRAAAASALGEPRAGRALAEELGVTESMISILARDGRRRMRRRGLSATGERAHPSE